ncbi:MAG: hypothetical protein HC824_05245 [Synechococcales cyanobacterium RM1_1_8]|nr:hypothetical protein [Synechococcales cyanobacterium RM1_1_8]
MPRAVVDDGGSTLTPAAMTFFCRNSQAPQNSQTHPALISHRSRFLTGIEPFSLSCLGEAVQPGPLNLGRSTWAAQPNRTSPSQSKP